jgi:UPF0755 protein
MSEMSLSDVVLRPQEPERSGRSAQRKREKRQKRRRRRTFLAVVLSVVLVGGAVGIAWLGIAPIIDKLTEPDDYTGAGSGEVQVKIAPGSSGSAIAQVLAKQDVVKTEKAFVDAVRGDAKRAAAVQPGTYQLRRQMSGAAALAALLDPNARLKLTVTIPEGTRVSDTLDILSKQLGLPREDFEAVLKDPASLGIPAPPGGVKSAAEGYLYPSTYDFEPDVTANDVLLRMVAQGEKVLDAAGVPPEKRREVLVKASVVEAEAGRQADMAKVARVIENRLARGIKLQMDSTVSYATGKFDITTSDKDRASTSRYNTYRYTGTPVGPIESPGADAINAVVEPADGPWLFFVTVNPDNGDTRFAATEAEHNRNRAIFQEWLRDNP